MNGLLDITLLPPRCKVLRRRVHHALTGFALIAYGVGTDNPTAVVAGTVLVLSDWHDRTVWLPDFIRHPDAR